MQEAALTIGEVARRAGLRTSAIRYYESIGVLPEPERQAGQRRYGLETIRRLHVIDVAKRAGFSLEETRALLVADADETAHAELREIAVRKLPEIDALIERAQTMRDWLSTATGCGCPTLDVCGLFEPTATPLRVMQCTPRAGAGVGEHVVMRGSPSLPGLAAALQSGSDAAAASRR